ncbi:hypothetical protein [Nevskia sp.]|uniref:hypothetical protein n=1 Tax=Nevskia sp. TaxID=1929292 RepID=UPI0025E4E7CF|nr:hypothetical protein [Nevskia sp.]
MLRSFIDSDIYRVMLGSEQPEALSDVFLQFGLQHEGNIRLMRRDDGSGVHVAMVLVDGDTLERIALSQRVMMMQIDNISARLRAVPSLPGGGSAERTPRFAPLRLPYGVAA